LRRKNKTMNAWKNRLLAGALALATFAVPALAQASKTGTTTLSVGIATEASLVVNTATTTLTQASDAGMFGNFTGATALTYKIRTTKNGGTGSITAAVAAFAAGGPSVTNDLSYTSTGGGLGTVVTDQAASTSGANVLTFGPNNRSARAGNSASVNWTLIDDPQVETGNYTSLVTFTISAT
jgi:hypothetical protein